MYLNCQECGGLFHTKSSAVYCAADCRRSFKNRQARYYRRRDYQKWRADTVAFFAEFQNGLCAICGELLADEVHLDHRLPKALGGGNGLFNLQLACRRCNEYKGAYSAREVQLRMLPVPAD